MSQRGRLREPAEDRAVVELGLPRVDGARVLVGGGARLRGGRGHGRHRRPLPAARRGAAAVGAPRDAGVRGPRTLPAVHAAGLGCRARGASSRGPRRWPARSVPTSWSCTRRSGGRRSTPATSSTGSPRWRSPRGSRSRWRTCTRGGPRGAHLEMYLPGWDPSTEPYANTTIDLSHAAIARADVVAMAERLGPRLRHVHLTDGTDSAKDEHLVPGRGDTGAGGFLQHLARTGFSGEVVLEINTRRCTTREEREADLRESLEFALEHLAVEVPRRRAARSARAPDGHDRVPPRGRRRGSPDTRAAILSGRPRAVRRLRLRGYDDPRGRRVPPASTRRWCTTTSAPRTTSSSPRWSSLSTLRAVMAERVVGPLEGAGERLLRALLSVWDDPPGATGPAGDGAPAGRAGRGRALPRGLPARRTPSAGAGPRCRRTGAPDAGWSRARSSA